MPQIPTNTKKTTKPYKQDVFEIYRTWKSIPILLKRNPDSILAKDIGSDDPKFKEILVIQTQEEFAKKYHIQESTLSYWNEIIRKDNVCDEIKKWSRGMIQNMLYSLYTKAIKTGDPKCAQLFFEVVCDWKPPRKMKDVEPERILQPIKEITFVYADGQVEK